MLFISSQKCRALKKQLLDRPADMKTCLWSEVGLVVVVVIQLGGRRGRMEDGGGEGDGT